MRRGLVALVAGAGLLVAAGCGSESQAPVVDDPAAGESTSPTSTPEESETAGHLERIPWPVYYVRETPMGPRLAAEWHDVPASNPFDEALALVAQDPNDPDYRTAWPASLTVVGTSFDGIGEDGFFGVELGIGDDLARPSGMSEQDARLALAQVARTLQGVGPRTRAAVDFWQDRRAVDTLLGVDMGEHLQTGPDLEELVLMNVASPPEGAVVTEGTLRASGWHNGFEATVWWRVLDGKEVLLEDALVSGGWMEERLFPWEVDVDVSDLPPGEYTFVAGNDDPTGGTEGMGTSEDTKTFVIE